MGPLTHRECAHCSTTNTATCPFCVSCGASLSTASTLSEANHMQQQDQEIPAYASGLPARSSEKMQAVPISLVDLAADAHDDAVDVAPLSNGGGLLQQQQLQYEKVSMHRSVQRGLFSRRKLLVGLAGVTAMGGGLLLAHQWSRSRPVAPARQVPVLVIPTPLGTNSRLLPVEDFALDWSSDGRYLGCSSAAGTLVVKDVTTSSTLVNDATNAINDLAWSPLNDALLACACDDGTVQMRQMPQDTFAQVYREHASPVQTLSWTQDGMYIASADLTPVVNVWEATSLHTVSSYSNVFNGQVTSLAWSPDGRYLACGCTDSTVLVLDIAKSQVLLTYTRHQQPVEAVAWSPDGRYLASAGDDNTVQVWSPETAERIALYSDHTEKVWCLAWSPDSQFLASGSWDKTVRIWKMGQSKAYQLFTGHQDRVVSLSWSKQWRIGSVDASGTILLWEMTNRSSGQI